MRKREEGGCCRDAVRHKERDNNAAFSEDKEDKEGKEMKEDLSKYSYEKALQEVLRVREEHQQRKGDSWKEMKDWQLLAKLKAKTNKVEEAIMCNYGNLDGMEETRKSLIGIVNYALFLLQKDIDDKAFVDEIVEKAVKRVEKPKTKHKAKKVVKRVMKKKEKVVKKSRGRPKKEAVVEKPKRKYTKRAAKVVKAPKKSTIEKVVEAEENGMQYKGDDS